MISYNAILKFGLCCFSRENQTTCAIAGAGRSPVTIPLAIISGIRGIPQISPLSTSEECKFHMYICIGDTNELYTQNVSNLPPFFDT